MTGGAHIAVASVSSYVLTWAGVRTAGEVHSVFSTSFNIELAGHLLHVGSADSPHSCLGMQLAPDAMVALLTSVRPHDVVQLRDMRVHIYSRAGTTELDMSSAPVEDTHFASLSRLDPVASGADAALGRMLAERDLRSHIGLPWPDRSDAAVTDLARFSVACLMEGRGGLSERDAVRVEAAVRGMRAAVAYLVGRGLGLTPSGDDVLCGFGCGLSLVAGAASDGVALFCREVLQASRDATTTVSMAYLSAMAAGYANRDYLELARALADSAPTRAARAIDRILGVGHTSGADGLLGFAAAFGCLM